MKTNIDLSVVGTPQTCSIDLFASEITAQALTKTKEIIKLPANCLVQDCIVEVTQAFNDTDASIIVGTAADDDAILAAGDITEATPGFYELATANKLRTTAETAINVKLSASAKHAAPTGKAIIYLTVVRLQP